MATRTITKADRKKDRDNALDTLRRCYPEGSTVYGIVRSVARSGMSRVISVVAIDNGRAWHPNYATAVVTGRGVRTVDGQDGVSMGGCGYSHIDAIATDIARALYGRDDALRGEYL